MSKHLQYKNSQVGFEVYGNGPELLLAFHGYGKDHSSLNILQDFFGPAYKIVSVDIFFHGASHWKEPEAPTTADWKAITELLLNHFNHTGKFSVFGYSIGGRLASHIAFNFTERLKTLWLVAATVPGGNIFYNFAVKTWPGQWLFKSFVKHPTAWLTLFSIVQKMGIIKSSLHAFTLRKIDTGEKRRLLYDRWQVLKNCSVPPPLLKNQLNQFGVQVMLIFGSDDYVIARKTAVKFAKGIKNATLLLSENGHHLVKDDVLHWVKRKLKEMGVEPF